MMNWAYVAGFLDADGSISWSSGKSMCCRIRFHQADRRPLEIIQSFLNGAGIDTNIVVTTELNGHPQHKKNLKMHALQLRTYRRNIIPFLRKVMPYLVVKKVTAQDVLRFFGLYPKLHWKQHHLRPVLERFCSLTNCNRKYHAKSLCHAHYSADFKRKRKHNAVESRVATRNA